MKILLWLYWAIAILGIIGGYLDGSPLAFFLGCIMVLAGVAWVAYRSTDDTYYGSDGYV